MTPLIPERFGCGAKLSLPELQSHLTACGVEYIQSYAFSEKSPYPSVRSIDKIYQIGVSAADFATLAIIHAGADLLCGGGQAATLDVGFEFGPDLALAGRLELSKAVFAAASKAGIEIGKCHSTFGPVTALTLALSGLKAWEFDQRSETGVLILTRPLGGMSRLYHAALHEDEDERHRWVSRLAQAHDGLIATNAAKIHNVVDVSGFGLAGALYEVAQSLEASIRIDTKVLDLTIGGFGVECLTSELGTLVDMSQLDDAQKVKATTREFCGPMIFSVADKHVEGVIESGKTLGFADIAIIGRFGGRSAEVCFV